MLITQLFIYDICMKISGYVLVLGDGLHCNLHGLFVAHMEYWDLAATDFISLSQVNPILLEKVSGNKFCSRSNKIF